MSDLIANDYQQEIRNLLGNLSTVKEEITIVVVANVKGVTETNDYEKHSVITDFFSEAELEEIVTGYRNFGFYTEVFTDETDFIKAVVNNKLDTIPGKRKLIYNTSQKGIGAGRHSLIPAFCKVNNIAYIGSNAYVSCLCRHKYHFNALLSKFHSNLPAAWLFEPGSKWLMNNKPPEGLKVIVKPVYEAASIGISKESVFSYLANKDSWLEECVTIYKQPASVEEFIEGYEVEVPFIITDKVCSFGPVGISLNGKRNLENAILSYEEVYDDGYSFYNFQELNTDINKQILRCTELSATALGIEDFGRIDYRISADGKLYLTDITTGPHTIHHSSCNFIFKEMGFTHAELMATLAAVAAKRYGWI